MLLYYMTCKACKLYLNLVGPLQDLKSDSCKNMVKDV